MSKKTPAGGRGDVVYLTNLDTNNTTHPHHLKTCICYGYAFVSRQTLYLLCVWYYTNTKAGSHLNIAARLLKGLTK